MGPLAMGTSNPVTLKESYGGVARNVAENLARLGLPVRLMTAVGDDAQGAALLQHARDLGMDTSVSLVTKEASTGTYTAMLDQDGEMVIAMADMAVLDSLTLNTLNDRRSLWASTRMRVVDMNLGKTVLSTLIKDSHQRDANLIVVAVSEPKMDHLPRSLEGVSTLILNEGELAVRAKRTLRTRNDAMIASLDVQQQGAKNVIVTMGSEGVLCCAASGKPKHLKAPRCRILDVTGAGDAFSAGVVANLTQQPDDLIQACRFGQRLAVLTLGCRSSVAPTLTPALLSES
jgi:pseudouridine kinase